MIFEVMYGEWRLAGRMAAARLSGRVRRVPCPGDVLLGGRDGAVSGRGAADVHVGGGGAGGDVARGMRKRPPGFELVVAVTMSVGGDAGGGDHGQGRVVGGGPSRCGQRGSGGTGPHGGDQGAAGGGERQVPGCDRLAGAGALPERLGDGGGRAGGGVDEFGSCGPGGVLLPDQLRGGRAQDRPGGRAGVVDGRLGLPQGGLGAVPPPPVGLGQQVGGVGVVVEQVGDQAERAP